MWPNYYGSCVGGSVAIGGADVIKWFRGSVGGSVAIGGAGVIKWLWEMCWWECNYSRGWCHQMFMGAVLVGV